MNSYQKAYHEQENARTKMLQQTSKQGDVLALVTTLNALLLVNLNTKTVFPIEFNRPDYYGISWFPDGKDLVLGHSEIRSDKLITLADFALSELGYLSHGEQKSLPFLSEPHQILCASDGRVICTNTGRNALSVVDLSRPNVFQEVRITPPRWDLFSADNTTGDHLNSVFEKDKKLYVIAHRFKKGSALAILSYPDLEIISIKPLDRTSLHNIWVTDEGQQIACGSEEGGLIELNGEKTKLLWQAGTPIFARGLAASTDFVLVGESQYAAREMRSSSMSGMWLIDRNTWQPMDYFALGLYGDVRDIRLLNIPDEAHHGHVFQGLESLLTYDICHTAAVKKIQISRFVQENAALSAPRLGDEILISEQKQALSINNLPEIENWGIWSHAETAMDTTMLKQSQKKIILGNGWGEIEDWGVWTDGKEAIFSFDAQALPTNFAIELRYIGMVLPAYLHQSFEIYAEDNTLLAEFDYTYDPEGKAKNVRFNVCKIKNASTMTIVLKMLNPVNPQDNIEGTDPRDYRHLGLGLQRIKIIEAV